MAVGGASLRKCIAVYFPRWLQRFHQSNFIHVDKYCALVTTPWSHFNECSHFHTLQRGPFQSFEEECYFSGHSPINLAHVHSHYVIALEIAASTASWFSIPSIRTRGFHTRQKKPLGR